MLTLRPYAPLILLLRCQSNFLAIRTECAGLWNRCVRACTCFLAAGCFLRCAGKPCMWWIWQSKCLRRSLLPAPCVGEQVERWQAGQRAELREQGKMEGKERLRRTGKRKMNSQSCMTQTVRQRVCR